MRMDWELIGQDIADATATFAREAQLTFPFAD